MSYNLILFLTLNVLIAKSEHSKGWETVCKIYSCQSVLKNCISNGCLGKDSCRSCIEVYDTSCSRCFDDIINEAVYAGSNGQSTIICDKANELHLVSCELFCRTNFITKFKCEVLNGLPICNCLGEQPIISTTIDLTTSTASTTTTTSTTSTTTTTVITTTLKSNTSYPSNVEKCNTLNVLLEGVQSFY